MLHNLQKPRWDWPSPDRSLSKSAFPPRRRSGNRTIVWSLANCQPLGAVITAAEEGGKHANLFAHTTVQQTATPHNTWNEDDRSKRNEIAPKSRLIRLVAGGFRLFLRYSKVFAYINFHHSAPLYLATIATRLGIHRWTYVVRM